MAPIILIAGLGRCGTSLVMQMLEAAGVPCVGTFPDFEVLETHRLLKTDPSAWAQACAGKAVKVLDPHRSSPPLGPRYRTIWLERAKDQQARSQLKLIGATSSRSARRAMEQTLKRESMAAKAALWSANANRPAMLELSFEKILADPLEAAKLMTFYLARDLDDRATMRRMADCVIPRSPSCLPGFLEGVLLARAGAVL